MGTGWRRAFCTTISRDRDATVVVSAPAPADLQSQQAPTPSPKPSPRNSSRLGFFKSSSTPSTPRLQSQSPRLRCKTNNNNVENSGNQTVNDILFSPNLRCKTTTKLSPKSLLGSNPSSPRSPFSILRNSLRLSRNNCGVCTQSVKRGQGMAIYTAECSHTFHFPCIAAHLNKQTTLICPVCNTTWKDVPLLAIHKLRKQESPTSDTGIQSNKFQDQVIKKERTPITSPRPMLEQQDVVKCSLYADDEPLLTPRAGSGVITIPEVNENEDVDEIEEFKGFFVNPVSSSADESLINARDVQVRLMPEAAIVSVSRTHETYAVVLRVKAPPPPPAVVPPAQNSGAAQILDPSRRAPIDLVTVLDVSASMGGTKLQMLKRAMRLVISSLGSADRLSIVAFSATPKRLMPLKRMTVQGQRSARRIIDRLTCSQGASAGEALRKATKVLEDRRERNPVASIMLLSDGQDEQMQESDPNQRPESTHVSSTRFAHVEIPVHAFGYGGKASYSPEPAENAFAKCVGGLLSVVVQDLRLKLGFASGSDPAEITAVYSCNGRPTVLSSGCIRFGDLYAEEEREILVELQVPRSAAGSHHVLSARCCYKDPATQETVYGGEKALLVPRAQAVRPSVPRIERLRNLFIATRAVAESRRLVEQKEVSTAQHLLSSARALVMQSSSISADEYARGLEGELAEVQWRREYQQQLEQEQRRRGGSEREAGVSLMFDENGEPLTPTSAWRAAEKLAKVAVMKKSVNRVSDLHGFENARF